MAGQYQAGSDTYANLAHARVGLLTDTVLPGYIGLYVSELNRALITTPGVKIEADTDQVPAMMAYRRDLTETAAKASMLSINEQRALLGYPRHDDEDADVR